MNNLYIIISLLTLCPCFDPGVTKPVQTEYSSRASQEREWHGRYYFQASNKDGLSTSFDIRVKALDDITIVYVGDGEKAETYKNLKARILEKDSIEITFNEAYGEMGIITIEKNGAGFLISGQAIYAINPGNASRTIKKVQ